MKQSSIRIWIFAGLLVLTNALWVYITLDNGVTITYQSDEIGYQKEAIKILASLVRELPRKGNAQEVYKILSSRYPDTLIKLEGDTVDLENVSLVYSNGVLTHVGLL